MASSPPCPARPPARSPSAFRPSTFIVRRGALEMHRRHTESPSLPRPTLNRSNVIGAMDEFQLITVDPGHFHAALIQKSMYAGVSKRASVYAPLGPDLIAHLNRLAGFNLRQQNPTAWELDRSEKS